LLILDGMTAHLLPNYKWIKFPVACLDDPAFMCLDNATAGIYVKLYLLAARSDSAGLLCSAYENFDLQRLAWHLRLPADVLQQGIAELTKAGLMQVDGTGYRLIRFMHEQGPGDNLQREKWIERQRKSRARLIKPETDAEVQEEAEKDEDLREEAD
jgi:hypothetical protein